MNRIVLSVIIGLTISSCNSSEQSGNNADAMSSETTGKEFYLRKMEEKNFQFEIIGSCDDALEDTIHKESTAYIDATTLTDSNVVVEFKFIEACCQEFLGDYSIENDTLKFKFEQVNDVMCPCSCWYRYKLTINEPKKSFKEIVIKEK